MFKTLCEESSCVFLLSSAISSESDHWKEKVWSFCLFLYFYFLKYPWDEKRYFLFQGTKAYARSHKPPPTHPWFGRGEGRGPCCLLAVAHPVCGLVELHHLAATANVSGLVIFTSWARMGCICHGQRGIGLQKWVLRSNCLLGRKQNRNQIEISKEVQTTLSCVGVPRTPLMMTIHRLNTPQHTEFFYLAFDDVESPSHS